MSSALLSLALLAATAPVAAPAPPCEVGSYRFADDSLIDVGISGDAGLRWRRLDGTTGALVKSPSGEWSSTYGWTGRPDGHRIRIDCARHRIDFDGKTAEHMAFATTETRFAVEGADLAGRLILPPGDGSLPIVVLIHGAENASARDLYALQRQFPAVGIGAFVYDKRGTGASGGDYTHDYLTLAIDAIAARHEAKRLAGDRAGPIGYQAGSQGGWVAPLAARIDGADFIIVGFGQAVSPIAAERELIAIEMADNGHGPDIVAKAMEVADAVEAVIASDFQGGYDQVAAVRAKYGKEPWFAEVRGSVTAPILETPPDIMRVEGPKRIRHIPLDYDPMPVLRTLDVPQLWILAADDRAAPSPETARRLAALADAGAPITTAIFAHTDHGIYDYETRPDGTRVSTRAPAGYFPMMRDFIQRGTIGADDGAQSIHRPAVRAEGQKYRPDR